MRLDTFVAVAVVSSLMISATGCGYDFLDPATQKKPAREAVVGAWRLDKAGLVQVQALAKSQKVPILVLNEDGGFTARDVPDWWNDTGRLISGADRYWTLASSSGTWRLEENIMETKTTWMVTLSFPALPGMPRGFSSPLYLYNQSPPYRLGVILGDPDLGEFLFFERVDEAVEKRAALKTTDD